MADWTNIADSALDPDAPVTSELAYAWRDNPIAIAEGAVGAPYDVGNWHPDNGVTVGDGNNGVIYNGTSASLIASPTFASGYDYLFVFEDVGASGVGITSLAFEVGGTFTSDVGIVETLNGGVRRYGFVLVPNPMATTSGQYAFSTVSGANVPPTTSPPMSVIQGASGACTRLRFSASAGNFNSGSIAMLRRKISWGL